MSATAVHPCSTDTPPAGWPPVQVLALYPRRPPGATPAHERAAAQCLARQVLVQHVGAAAATPWLALPPAGRGAQRLSFSHETEASLLAWCPTGAIGVDLVDLDSLAQASQQELVATAALYLGPDGAAAVAGARLASEARVCFAWHWASLEARLKCLGLALDEWQPALDTQLSSAAVVRVRVMDGGGQASARWIACVAWHDGAGRAGRAAQRAR